MPGQEAQGLQVGQGVVHPPAGPAVEVEGLVALLQAVADGQHGVRVIFFHGEGVGRQVVGAF